MNKFYVFLSALLVSASAMAASPVALVYVQPTVEQYAPAPVYVYAAASNGELTQVKGSSVTLPQIVGTNGTHFITVDNTPGAPYLRSYDLASDGLIGKEVSSVNLATWSWWGGTAELDHTGQSVYVYTTRGDYSLLNLSLSKSGDLKFQGIANAYEPGLPTITGNNKFAYGFNNYCADGGNGCDCGSPDTFVALNRESNGSLEGIAFSETDPIAPGAPGSGNQYYPEGAVTNDPTNHLAVVVSVFNGGCQANYNNQIASYTVGSQGDLVSTNTWENMPTLPPNDNPTSIVLDPAGTVLAVTTGTGIQFFHFNGAKPITPFTGVIGTSGYITTMAWDKDNHLYAINGASGKLHVYEATTTSVKEVSGSPYNNVCGQTTCTLVVRAD